MTNLQLSLNRGEKKVFGKNPMRTSLAQEAPSDVISVPDDVIVTGFENNAFYWWPAIYNGSSQRDFLH